jgi:hypothetical protein
MANHVHRYFGSNQPPSSGVICAPGHRLRDADQIVMIGGRWYCARCVENRRKAAHNALKRLQAREPRK